MQDKAIAAIGEWQLEENKSLEPVDLYIENMFPGKDYQMLLLVFEITNNNGEMVCEYKGIDIEKVSAEKEDYRKYAYRKGSPNGGDISFTTKLFIGKKEVIIENIRKKLPKTIKRHEEIIKFKSKSESITKEQILFQIIGNTFSDNFFCIIRELVNKLEHWASNDKTIAISTKIRKGTEDLYLRSNEVVKSIILDSASETKYKRKSPNAQSKSSDRLCSVTAKKESNIYGFAAPFGFSTPDKPGFISGFFNVKNNWKNYPISSDSSIVLELGRKYIEENLSARFYGHDYLIVPNSILKTNKSALKKIINILRTALIEQKSISRERKKRAEEYVMRIIANEDNYFNLDIVFFKTSQASMKIQLHLEEQLPSRFNKLFIEVPREINRNKIYHNIYKNADDSDIKFSFQIIKKIFSPQPKTKKNKFNSPYFLNVVNDIFRGNKISSKYLYEKIMFFVRLCDIESLDSKIRYDNVLEAPVKEAIMLIAYLHKLEIINYNKNYIYMETELLEKNDNRFNTEAFNTFVKENSNFLDSDIKVGIFSVGVFVKYLFDIQAYHLNTRTPPFEKKLRGYKLSPELLMDIYLSAIQKAKQYQKDYMIYSDLREIVSNYFMKNIQVLTKKTNENYITNNELSFYFVAGLEMGKQFKREKKEN